MIDARTDAADLVRADRHVVPMRGGMTDPSRRTRVVPPDVASQAVLKCPLDAFRVGMDAPAIMSQHTPPTAQIRRRLAFVLVEQGSKAIEG
ncbi:hypothetical protein [Mycolicibacterium chubuense]|uniref:hypothetical protein n=1 Tax=Mycolicibacterium chubuense TaxID=1800 RepID=UPI000315718E|nr:hypothetical protein [Mycolicibacterium chubuense]